MMQSQFRHALALLMMSAGTAFAQSSTPPTVAPERTSGTRSSSADAVAPVADLTPNSNVELIAPTIGLRSGAVTTLAFRITMDRGWHTYWTNPGDAGLPFAATWSLPPGVTVSSLRFPVPHLVPQPPLMSFGYENEVLVLADVAVAGSVPAGRALRIEADVDFLVCADVCLPASAHVTLAEPVVGSAAPSRWSSAIDSTRSRLTQTSTGWEVKAWRDGKRIVMLARATANTRALLQQVFLVPDSTGVLEHALPQTLAVTGDTIVLAMTPVSALSDTMSRLQGVLLNDAVSPTVGFQIDVALERQPPALGARLAQLLLATSAVQSGGVVGAAENTSGAIDVGGAPAAMTTAGADAQSGTLGVWLALVLAFGGGLLLNLMPCVFPVLSIKILAFVERGGDMGSGSTAGAVGRKHAMVFTLGVLVTFWALAGVLLALRAGGAQLGWGFQLQSPGVVAVLALVVFALALNLSGVFTVGASLTRLGAVGGGERYSDSFLTGLLAVVVATPCTAPFMGAALGFALTQPALIGMAVFTSLGLGLAAPYIVFASSPALLRKLPRPGAWLETLKQLLAFPLYATVVWLLWVLGRQAGADLVALTLLVATTLSFAGWFAGRSQLAGRTRSGNIALFVVALVIVGGGVLVGTRPVRPTGISAAPAGWEAWSPARVAEARASRRVVFVDFTAAWCLSCQVNERVALHTTAVEQAFANANVVLLRADWTSRSAEITQTLASFGRSGVPLYVVYPVDGIGAAEVLPAILTPGLVVDAVNRAAGRPVAARR